MNKTKAIGLEARKKSNPLGTLITIVFLISTIGALLYVLDFNVVDKLEERELSKKNDNILKDLCSKIDSSGDYLNSSEELCLDGNCYKYLSDKNEYYGKNCKTSETTNATYETITDKSDYYGKLKSSCNNLNYFGIYMDDINGITCSNSKCTYKDDEKKYERTCDNTANLEAERKTSTAIKEELASLCQVSNNGEEYKKSDKEICRNGTCVYVDSSETSFSKECATNTFKFITKKQLEQEQKAAPYLNAACSVLDEYGSYEHTETSPNNYRVKCIDNICMYEEGTMRSYKSCK